MRTHAARLIGQRTRRLPGTLALPAALWAGIGTTTAAGAMPMLLAAKTSRAVWVAVRRHGGSKSDARVVPSHDLSGRRTQAAWGRVGKAARLERERRRPPPVQRHGGAGGHRHVWRATGVVALVIAVGVGVLVATRPSSGVPPPVQPSAADRGAPPSLVKAASAIGFRPSTEPGVGVVEGKPASAAQPPANAGLLPVGSRAPSFALETPEGKTVGLSSLRGRAVLLEADSSVHGGAAVRDPDRGRQGT